MYRSKWLMFSCENWAQSGFPCRNFYRQHLRNFYQKKSEICEYEVFEVEIFIFSPRNLLPLEISKSPKFLQIEKYEFSASFCTSNQLHCPKTRKARLGQSWRISRFRTQNTKVFQVKKMCAKSWNPPTLTETSFASFGAMKLIRSAKWSWELILFDF